MRNKTTLLQNVTASNIKAAMPCRNISKLFIAITLSMPLSMRAQNIFPANGNVGIGTATPSANLQIKPSQANAVQIGNYGAAAGNTGELRFTELPANGTNYVGFKAPDAIGNSNTAIWTLPNKDGSSGQVLSTNGVGVLSWVTGGSTKKLDNLSNVAVNQSLIPKNNNAIDLGSAALVWRNGYFGGNVGIGTVAPAAKLDVTGDAKISGFLNGISVGLGGNGEVSNTAVGYKALFSNTTGNSNVANGYNALLSNTTGAGLTASGYYALAINTTGKNNSAYGYAALGSNKSGNGNTAVGFGADVGVDELTNATAIGNGAIVDASDKVRIGDASVSSYSCQVDWTSGSDARIKDNVQENVPGLAFIAALRPVTFHYNVSKQNKLMGITDDAQWEGKNDIEKIAFTGFIAQDVDAAAQKIGYDFSGVDKSGMVMGLRYAEFVVPLTKAVQELNLVQNGLQVENTNLHSKIDAQQKQIDELKTQVGQLLSALPSTSTTIDGAAKISFETENASPLLGQNIPNPFDNSTVIPFRIPKGCNSASIVITASATGKIAIAIPVSCDQSHVLIDAGSLVSGGYQYTLYIDGKIFETRQMILNK